MTFARNPTFHALPALPARQNKKRTDPRTSTEGIASRLYEAGLMCTAAPEINCAPISQCQSTGQVSQDRMQKHSHAKSSPMRAAFLRDPYHFLITAPLANR